MNKVMYVYFCDLIYIQRTGILSLTSVSNGRVPSRFLISQMNLQLDAENKSEINTLCKQILRQGMKKFNFLLTVFASEVLLVVWEATGKQECAVLLL
jgi:hypothetical protein